MKSTHPCAPDSEIVQQYHNSVAEVMEPRDPFNIIN